MGETSYTCIEEIHGFMHMYGFTFLSVSLILGTRPGATHCMGRTYAIDLLEIPSFDHATAAHDLFTLTSRRRIDVVFDSMNFDADRILLPHRIILSAFFMVTGMFFSVTLTSGTDLCIFSAFYVCRNLQYNTRLA